MRKKIADILFSSPAPIFLMSIQNILVIICISYGLSWLLHTPAGLLTLTVTSGLTVLILLILFLKALPEDGLALPEYGFMAATMKNINHMHHVLECILLYAHLDPDDIAITFMYYDHIRRKRCFDLIILFLAWSLLYVLSETSESFSLTLPLVPIVVYWLQVVGLQTLRFRIVYGYFGYNEHEARKLIRFILDHSDSIDFFDDNGEPVKVLLTEQYPVARIPILSWWPEGAQPERAR